MSLKCKRHWRLFMWEQWFVWSFQHGSKGWFVLRVRHPHKYISAPFSCIFPKEVPSLSWYLFCRKSYSYFPSVLRTPHSNWRRRKFRHLQMGFFNSLSPHPWLQAILFWDFPLANSFGRVLQAEFQLVRLCPVCVGAAKPGCGFPVLLDGIPLLTIHMGMTSPLCRSKGKGSYARVLHWFTRGKSFLLLLTANSLALRSRDHPVLEGKGLI